MDMQFDFDGSPVLTLGGTALALRENGDFWRLHLDCAAYGGTDNRELGVYSHAQEPPAITRTPGKLELSYPRVRAEDGRVFDIALTLTVVREEDGTLSFAVEIANRSSVRVNELQYPLIGLEHTSGDFAEDEFVAPVGLGFRSHDPYRTAQSGHTEYMAADYKTVWRVFSYPGEMSMPWFGIESGGHFLYLGRHSALWRQCAFLLGSGPREESAHEVILAAASYPAVRPGETLCLDGFVLAEFAGDWRRGADCYRAWAERSWYTPRHSDFAKIDGWQRVILKTQYGEILHTYADLPAMYREGARRGIPMLLVFAWWVEGMDNGYPAYRPDPALGGEEGLRDAIRTVHAEGGTVILYANGHLIDVRSDFAREHPDAQMIDIDGNAYREAYRFANNGTLLRYGNKSFVTGCYGAAAWREKILEIERRHLALGSDGTFFDQLGINFYFCFDERHDHGARIDLDPELRLRTAEKMRGMLAKGQYFGTEWAIDRFAGIMDFIHGCGFGQSFSEDAYPAVFRYTFPETIVSNRFLHDEREGWKRHLNYAFLHGLIFDVSIYRGRAPSLEIVPVYAAYLGTLTALRRRYIDFFTRGRYDLPAESLPERVRAVRYTLGDREITVFWNDSDVPCTVGETEMAPQSVWVRE